MLLPLPRVYLRLLRCAFQRRAAYRLANLTGITVNFFFFLVHAQVFLAFFGGGREVAGWSGREAVLYFATSEALLMALGAMNQSPAVQLADRIRSGDVACDLTKPLALWRSYVAAGYGDAAYYLLARAVILYGAATSWYGLWPPLAPELLALPLSLAMAIGISAQLSYLAAATAYWIEHARGPIRVHLVSCFLFGGVVVPLDFYPDAFRSVCELLPYSGMIYTPIALASGKLTGVALTGALVHQGLWVGALGFVCGAVEERGTRRLAVLGG